jgi:cell division protein FtsB
MNDEICDKCEVQICQDAEGRCELIAKLRAELEAAKAEIKQLEKRIAELEIPVQSMS